MSEIAAKMEVDIRGLALKISTIMEGSLMRIIFCCNAEHFSSDRSSMAQLRGFMFHQKIELAKGLLEKVHPDLFISHADLFLDLWNFKEFQYKMAHCLISWPEEDMTVMETWDISEEEGALFTPTRHTVAEISKTMIGAMNDIVPALVNLEAEIEARLQERSPELHQLVQGSPRH